MVIVISVFLSCYDKQTTMFFSSSSRFLFGINAEVLISLRVFEQKAQRMLDLGALSCNWLGTCLTFAPALAAGSSGVVEAFLSNSAM